MTRATLMHDTAHDLYFFKSTPQKIQEELSKEKPNMEQINKWLELLARRGKHCEEVLDLWYKEDKEKDAVK